MKVTYSIAAKLGGGGIGTTSYQAVSGIERAGLLQTVYTDDYNPEQVGLPLRQKLISTHASIIERLPFVPQKYQWFIKDYLHDFLVMYRLGPADIFHGWNGHCTESLEKARRLGAITVVERASSHPETYEKILKEEYQRFDLPLQPILPVVKRRLLRELATADYITSPSDFAYESMVSNGVPEKKLIKLPFGGEVVENQVQTAAFRNRDKRPSVFTVLFVGQVGLRKGVPYLLEAWRKLNLKEADLFLLGEVERAAEKIIFPYRGMPNIHFVGYTDPKPFYEKADVFIFPSIEEGSALVNYEALAAGLPIITTYNSGSVVENEKEGFIVPIRDSAALAERLRFLSDHPVRRMEMAAAAFIKAKQYTWTNYGDRLAGAYQQILSDHQ